MSNTNKPKEEMNQDLTHHKTEETDVLVKAENPADDFIREKRLDPETHGKEKDEKDHSSN